MNTRFMHWRTQLVTAVVLCAFLIASMSMLEGCGRIGKRWKKIDMNVPVHQVPPIKVEQLNGQYLLVMQAPNSGWSIATERDERIAEGYRLFITVRRPDPAFMYPQAIVEKRLLCDVDSSKPMEIFARLLDANEKTKGKGYGEITPVESFDE